jgi:uncharacterized protein (TIGR00251 family)
VEPEDWRRAVKEAGEGSLRIDLYVEPGASDSSLGPYDPWRQRIKARVTAPAIKGKANNELAAMLCGVLGAPPSAMRVARGATTRRKTVVVDGIEPEAAISALAKVLGEGDAQG